MIIAVFDINKDKDGAGNDIEMLHEYSPGATRCVGLRVDWQAPLTVFFDNSHPRAFPCNVSPRSEKAANLIRSASDDLPPEKGDGEILQDLFYGRL